MKQITSLALVMLFAFGSSFAKDRMSKHVTVKGDNVTVTYGQPSKKQALTIVDAKPWLTSVDEPAIVTLPKGCMFAGRQINPGTYSLITVPYKGEWIIYLTNKMNPTEADLDLGKLRGENMLYSNEMVGHSDKGVDQFTIEAVKDGLLISWDHSNIMIPVQPW